MNSLKPKRWSVAVLMVAALSLTNCASSRKSGYDVDESEAKVVSAQDQAMLTKAKSLWKERHDETKLKEVLTLLEDYIKVDPRNTEALLYLCRGYYLLADGFMTDKEEKRTTWEKGAYYGERSLALNPKVRKVVVDEKRPLEVALPLIGKDQVEPLYWTAVNFGKWARLSGIGTTLKFKDRIKGMIERVEKLEPTYFHGTVHRYWGTYYAVAPSFAGGDLTKSLSQYKKALEIAPDYLGTRVLMAENYAVKAGNRALFDEQLKTVLSAKPNPKSDIYPENLIEQTKAKRLADQVGELF